MSNAISLEQSPLRAPAASVQDRKCDLVLARYSPNPCMNLVKKKSGRLTEEWRSHWGAVLTHCPKASAHLAHRRSRSSSRNTLLQCSSKNRPENCGNVIEVDQTAPLIHFMHGL